MTTQAEIAAMRAEVDRLLDEQIVRERQREAPKRRIAELTTKLALAEIEQRAEKSAQEVAETNELAVEAEQARAALKEALDTALDYLAGLDIEALTQAIRAAENAFSVHDQWAEAARLHIQRDAAKDAETLRKADEKAFVAEQRRVRGSPIKRVVEVSTVFNAFLNESVPNTHDALRRAFLLAIAVDLRYLEQFEFQNVTRKQAQLDMKQAGSKQAFELRRKRRLAARTEGFRDA